VGGDEVSDPIDTAALRALARRALRGTARSNVLAAADRLDHLEHRRAVEVLDAGGWIAFNEYGTPISVHVCTACGKTFTVCPPASANFGDDCLAPECSSYDPARDAEVFFGPDDPELYEAQR
jgi:heterodisulfide reductase subunit A-like polyferredoxin